MTELFRRLRGSGTPVAVYYKTTGGFCTGFVREADDEFLAMEFISPVGKFDGYHCIRQEEILKMDAGTQYLSNLARVYRHYGEALPPFKISSKNVLESFIDSLARNRRLCTMEIGFDSIEKISGYVAGRDWNIVQIRLMDVFFNDTATTEIYTEAIVCIDTESEYERYLEVLSSLEGGEPDKGRKKKDGEGENVISFPFGK